MKCHRTYWFLASPESPCHRTPPAEGPDSKKRKCHLPPRSGLPLGHLDMGVGSILEEYLVLVLGRRAKGAQIPKKKRCCLPPLSGLALSLMLSPPAQRPRSEASGHGRGLDSGGISSTCPGWEGGGEGAQIPKKTCCLHHSAAHLPEYL